MTDSHPPATEADVAGSVASAFAGAARILLAAGSVDETLAQVVTLAVSTIEGCELAGIFVLEDGVVSSPARSDALVAEVDHLQQRTGEGPCLDAIARRAVVYAEDLQVPGEWPGFAAEAARHGIRSVLALPLPADGAMGALNLYSRYPRAFGVMDRSRGTLLAALAAVALMSARAHEGDERRVANLHDALATREVIGQAQGILMERERVTAEEAFELLRRASQHLNVKLREVAQGLVDTGERPDTGRGS